MTTDRGDPPPPTGHKHWKWTVIITLVPANGAATIVSFPCHDQDAGLKFAAEYTAGLRSANTPTLTCQVTVTNTLVR
jgi:hypothetical protein